MTAPTPAGPPAGNASITAPAARLAPHSSVDPGWARRLWTYRHPSLLPVIVLWAVIGLGMAEYCRVFSPREPSLLDSNDWLINYQGGFVRRGLVGELLYGFHQVLGFSSLTQDLLVLQMGLYVALGIVVTILAMGTTNRLLPWVLLSPAGVLFSSYSVLGGFRKELLLFLSLGLVALAMRATTDRAKKVLCVAAASLYVLFLFSWEAGALFLPVLLVYLRTALRPVPGGFSRRLGAALVATTIVGFVVQALNAGNAKVVAGICDSLARSGIPYGVNCLPGGKGIGAIAWLELSWHSTAHQVAGNWPGYGFYLFWLVLALVPFLASGWIARNRALTALCLAVVLPLFVVGSDYGRWIHLAIMCVSLYWLGTAPSDERAGEPRGTLEMVALFAWVTCWSITFWRDPFMVGGLWNVLASSGLLHHFQQILP